MSPQPKRPPCLRIDAAIDNGRVVVTVELPSANVFEAHTFERDESPVSVAHGLEDLARRIRDKALGAALPDPVAGGC